MFVEQVSFPAAFIAGLLSFLSPCILPLIPAYFTFITGYSLDELTDAGAGVRKKVILSTAAFIAGFSTVFILLGASASMAGGFLFEYKAVLRVAGGILIMVFGLHLTGILRIKGLEFEKRFNIEKRPIHFFGTFLVGMAFGAGWSPCVGPLLGSILILAGNQETVGKGILLLGVYSAGLAIPFVFISVFIHLIIALVERLGKAIRWLNLCSGVLLILMGAFLVLDKLRF